MDLRYTAAEQGFRDEVRAFVEAKLPNDIRDKVLGHRRVEKDDYVRWQRILHERAFVPESADSSKAKRQLKMEALRLFQIDGDGVDRWIFRIGRGERQFGVGRARLRCKGSRTARCTPRPAPRGAPPGSPPLRARGGRRYSRLLQLP